MRWGIVGLGDVTASSRARRSRSVFELLLLLLLLLLQRHNAVDACVDT